MSSLFGDLTMANSALDVQRRGMEVVGQNIANANTPGYARRVATLMSLGPDTPAGIGRGASITDVHSVRDRLLDRRVEQAVGTQQKHGAMANTLYVVEAGLGNPGSSLDGSLDRLFNAFSDLANAPASGAVRQQVQAQGTAVATMFHDLSNSFDAARRDADIQIRSAAQNISGLTARIAELNRVVGAAPSEATTLSLQDEQAQLVRELAGYMDISVLDRPGGGVDISATTNGAPLVAGETSWAMTVTPQPPSGLSSVTLAGQDVTPAIAAGRLGGLLTVRDATIPAYQLQLDTLASTLADRVNVLHQAGFDAIGAAGGEFFSFSGPLNGVEGAAAAITLSPGVAADAQTIAAAGTPDAGDNGTARALAALRGAGVLDGDSHTFADGWAGLVFSIGRDTKAASDAQSSETAVVNQIDTLRDQVSGVSLDEEAMNLLKFQRAYEANARFFATIDGVIDNLMKVVS